MNTPSNGLIRLLLAKFVEVGAAKSVTGMTLAKVAPICHVAGYVGGDFGNLVVCVQRLADLVGEATVSCDGYRGDARHGVRCRSSVSSVSD